MFSNDWCICIYIPATAGPIALPMTLIRRVVPSDVPLCCFGVDSATAFITPTMLRDKPVARMAKFTEIEDSVEWKTKKLKNPSVLIIVPNAIGLSDPNFDIMNPEVGPKIKNTKANGNWIYPTLIAFSPKPSGGGFLNNIDMVWKIINSENPAIIMIKFEGNIESWMNSLKSINGCFDRLSISINNIIEEIHVAIKPTTTIVEITELLLPLSCTFKNVSTRRNEITATANVIAPFISIALLLRFLSYLVLLLLIPVTMVSNLTSGDLDERLQYGVDHNWKAIRIVDMWIPYSVELFLWYVTHERMYSMMRNGSMITLDKNCFTATFPVT